MKDLYQNPDLLAPIGNQNRDEYILVPFDRGIKNLSFGVVKELLKRAITDPRIPKVFPRLHAFRKMTFNNMHDVTCLFLTPAHCLHSLSMEKIPLNECAIMADTYLADVDYRSLHQLRLEYVCFQLLKQDFVKHLYIQTDNVTTAIGQYCLSEFKDFITSTGEGSRASLLEGNMIDFLSEHHEITTVFTRSTQDIFNLEERDPEALKGKYFVAIGTYDDIEEQSDQQVHYKQEARLMRYMEDKICSVVHMYPYALISEERT